MLLSTKRLACTLYMPTEKPERRAAFARPLEGGARWLGDIMESFHSKICSHYAKV